MISAMQTSLTLRERVISRPNDVNAAASYPSLLTPAGVCGHLQGQGNQAQSQESGACD